MDGIQYSFSAVQVRALIKALEQCGINKGTTQSQIAAFNDYSLIGAANSAYKILRGKGRPVGEPELVAMRERLHAMREDHKALLSDAAELLKHSAAALVVLQEGGPEPDKRARALLSEGLQEFHYSDSDLSHKLAALESEGLEATA